jgi:hypothetical protein
MRIRIKLTNNLFFYPILFMIPLDLYVAIFNPIITNFEKAILFIVSIFLIFYALWLRKTIFEEDLGHILTIPKIHRVILSILLSISLFLTLNYSDTTPYMHW